MCKRKVGQIVSVFASCSVINVVITCCQIIILVPTASSLQLLLACCAMHFLIFPDSDVMFSQLRVAQSLDPAVCCILGSLMKKLELSTETCMISLSQKSIFNGPNCYYFCWLKYSHRNLN